MAQTKVMYQPHVLAADTLAGDKVVNHQKEDLGKIEHLMIDLANGPHRLRGSVLRGVPGHGRQAICHSLERSQGRHRLKRQFILNVDKEVLKICSRLRQGSLAEYG